MHDIRFRITNNLPSQAIGGIFQPGAEYNS